MKNICFALGFAIIQLHGFSQLPFPEEGNWRVDAFAFDIFSGCEEDYYYQYYINGDTVIQAETYQKIWLDTVLTIPRNANEPCYVYPIAYDTGYVGGIRVDTVKKVVRFVHPTLESPELLYDYNLQIGDTIKGFLIKDQLNCPLTITAVENIVSSDGLERKKWSYIDCKNEESGYYIEGIGSDRGLIERLTRQNFANTSLVCVVKEDKTSVYDTHANSTMGCAKIVAGINDILTYSANTTFTVFPNPSQGVFQIEGLNPTNTWSVKTTSGKIILQDNSTKVDLSHLSNGLYFLQINNEGATHILKLLKL